MSQLVLDDQLDVSEVLPPLRKWITAVRLHDLRPHQVVRDERVPSLLLTLSKPTFVTIDSGFWKRRLCHEGYCLLYFALATDEQYLLPGLLRRLFLLPEFKTRNARMAKVARVGPKNVDYWEIGEISKTSLILPKR
jgi:hypothetical protein